MSYALLLTAAALAAVSVIGIINAVDRGAGSIANLSYDLRRLTEALTKQQSPPITFTLPLSLHNVEVVQEVKKI